MDLESLENTIGKKLNFVLIGIGAVGTIVIISVVILFLSSLGGKSIDKESIETITNMTKQFDTIKKQNDDIIKLNLETNDKLDKVLQLRGAQRDKEYKELLDYYKSLKK